MFVCSGQSDFPSVHAVISGSPVMLAQYLTSASVVHLLFNRKATHVYGDFAITGAMTSKEAYPGSSCF